jgi:hypothetical protein
MENIIGVIALIWTAIASIWESWGQVIAWGLAGALVVSCIHVGGGKMKIGAICFLMASWQVFL